MVATTIDSTLAVGTTVPAPVVPIGIDVADDAIPAGVSDAYVARDGQLLDTATVFERYGIPTLPYPDSPAAFVTDIQTTVTPIRTGGYRRYDAVTWVFVDPRMASEIITAAEISAGIDERPWESLSLEAFQLADGAKCVQSERANQGVGGFWSMIDCARLDGTHSLQIIREEFADEAAQPPAAADSIAAGEQVAAAIGATLAGWELNLVSPGNPPATRTKVIYQTRLDQPALGAALRGTLVGYTESADDGYNNQSFDAYGVAWKISNSADADGTVGQAAFVSPGNYADWT